MEEGLVEVMMIFVTHDETPKVAEPADGALDNPAMAVAAKLATILRGRFNASASMRTYQVPALLGQTPSQWIAIVGPIGGRVLSAGRGVCWSVLSASVTSAGDALEAEQAKGIPWPSATTIHFVPFSRLVFPTPAPLFLQGRSCRPETLLPNPPGLAHRAS